MIDKETPPLTAEEEAFLAATRRVDRLTSLASDAFSRGFLEVYEEPRENMEGSLGVQWEYKKPDEESQIFGPFTSAEMRSWVSQGYFRGPYMVMVRKRFKATGESEGGKERGEGVGEWMRSDTVEF